MVGGVLWLGCTPSLRTGLGGPFEAFSKLFCKQTSIPATIDLSTAIDPTGTNFLHTPPTTRTQYPNKNAMANTTLLQGTEKIDSTDEDDDNQRRIMSSFQAFCTDRFINTTSRQIYPSTTKMPIAMNHMLDESTPHLLDVQSDVSTFQGSDFNQLDFPIDPHKDNNEHSSRYQPTGC